MTKIHNLHTVISTISLLLLVSSKANCDDLGQPAVYTEQQLAQAPPVLNHGEDSYVLLTDDELLHNADMLRHLASATKEEIEELVESNPHMQELLLQKVKKILQLRQDMANINNQNHLLANRLQNELHSNNQALPPPVPGAQINMYDQSNIPINIDLDNEDDLHENLNNMDAIRVEMLKAKLKSNAAKLFRVGSSLKKKLKALRKKKAQLQAQIPRFHMNVTTNKS